jgi:preprotein translocase subunit SecG
MGIIAAILFFVNSIVVKIVQKERKESFGDNCCNKLRRKRIKKLF